MQRGIDALYIQLLILQTFKPTAKVLVIARSLVYKIDEPPDSINDVLYLVVLRYITSDTLRVYVLQHWTLT